LAIAGVAFLALITAGIWIGLLMEKTPAEAPAVMEPKPKPAPVLQSIALEPAQIELEPGQKRFLRVLAIPSDASLGQITWASLDSTVAVVVSGEIRALQPGRTTVEARAGASQTAVCEVLVGGRPLPPDPPPKLPEAAIATRVSITSAPPFAEVFLDNKYLGTTPLKKSDLPPGRRRIQISHRNFRPLDTTIHIRPGANRFKFR
jgi:hypothetical protein